MNMRFVSLTLFVLLTLSVLSVPVSANTWVSIKSNNFNLIGNADEKDIRAAAVKLETFRAVFARHFPGVTFHNSTPTNVVVFRNNSSYNPFRPKTYRGKPATDVTGYTFEGSGANYITVIAQGEKKDTYEQIFHSYAHYMMDNAFGKRYVPAWLTEGIAEYFQTMQVKDGKVTVGGPTEFNQLLLQNMRLQEFSPFASASHYAVFRNGRDSNFGFSAQSWALIHYLIHDRNVKGGGFEKYISLLEKKVPHDQAFNDAFGINYGAADTALAKYSMKTSFSTVSGGAADMAFAPGAAVSPVSDAITNAHLGKILLESNELAEAEKYLRMALAADANSGMANAVLGLVRVKQGKAAEAISFAEKALPAAGNDPYIHYAYAHIISKGGTDAFNYVRKFPADQTKKMRGALKKAIELNPNYADSYNLLSFIDIVNDENADEAHTNAKKGKALQPGNSEFDLLMAQTYAQKEMFKEAKAIVEELKETGEDVDLRNRADYALKNIEQSENITSINAANRKKFDDQIADLRKSRTEKYIAPEEIARLQREAPNNSLNRSLTPLSAGEMRAVGYIQKIACVRGVVIYTFKTDKEVLTLSTKDFSTIELQALTPEGERSFGCDADFGNVLSVINYVPKKSAAGQATLTAVAFVPKTFKLKTEEEIARSEKPVYSEREVVPQIIVNQPSARDEAMAKEEGARRQAEYDEQMKDQMMTQVRQLLRKPQEGERQALGTIEKIDCESNKVTVSLRGDTSVQKFRTNSLQNVILKMLTNEYSNVSLNCGTKPPPMLTVVTYAPDTKAKSKETGVLIAIEFVPRTFTLE